MKGHLFNKIKSDLTESKINTGVIIAFIPIAFFTYLFHEFGHFIFGEISGTEMTMSLNNSSPKSGVFLSQQDALWSAVGGPIFTILQALIFSIIAWKSKSMIAFSFSFFAVFSRFFSIVFGGVELQDEARIATMLNMNEYFIAAVSLLILFLTLWVISCKINIKLMAFGYFIVLSVISVLIVIGTYTVLN